LTTCPAHHAFDSLGPKHPSGRSNCRVSVSREPTMLEGEVLLSREERRLLLVVEPRSDPSRSDRAFAKVVRRSDKTAKARRELGLPR
jgi:hypothetical protein